MFKILGLVTGALAAAAGMLAVTGVPRVAGVDWQASVDEPLRLPAVTDPAALSDRLALTNESEGRATVSGRPADTAPVDGPGAQHTATELPTAIAPTGKVSRRDAPTTPATEALPPSDGITRAVAPIGEAPMPAAPAASTGMHVLPTTGLAAIEAIDADDPTFDRSEAITTPDADEGSDERRAPAWQPVWAPFRSELSARGFMGRLERLTDLRYRVSKLGPGLYQVAFAHADVAQRTTGIAAIEDATGLDLARVSSP